MIDITVNFWQIHTMCSIFLEVMHLQKIQKKFWSSTLTLRRFFGVDPKIFRSFFDGCDRFRVPKFCWADLSISISGTDQFSNKGSKILVTR